MTFSSSGLQKIVDAGLTSGAAVWRYVSTESSTQVNATGFFSGCGVGSPGGANAFGMKIGDTLISQESSGGATPGRCTLHGVTGSTWNQASSLASSAYSGAFDITVSAAAT